MKKVFAVVMAFTILFCYSVIGFAADYTLAEKNMKEIDVIAKYSASVNTPEVYSVDISWDSMTFTYTQNDTKNWDADNHSYVTETDGGWNKTTSSVKVTNHSNVAVDVSIEYTAIADTGVSGSLSKESAVLSQGEEGNYDGADSVTSVLTVSGKPTSGVSSEGIKVGSLKITIE